MLSIFVLSFGGLLDSRWFNNLSSLCQCLAFLAKFSRLQDLFRVYIIASKRDAVQVGVCRLVRQVGCFTTLGGWAADREPLQQSYHSLCERSSVAKSHVATT